MKRAIFSLSLLVALLAPAAALARSQTASAGSVSATFTFSGHYPRYHGERLTIRRAGMVVYAAPVAAELCGGGCAPGAADPRRPSVHVLDLEHNGDPDVVLDLFSGGAHCCSIEQVFSYDRTTGTYVKTEHNFGDPGEQIRLLAGQYLFFTADDSFAYAFTDFAASGLPIEILSFYGQQFHDVTRNYPALIERDASRWLKLFRRMASQRYADSVGVAAAWAADEELLGHRKLVAAFLHRQARAGHLNSALSPSEPSGERFVRALYRLLRKDGYLAAGHTADEAALPACRTGDLGARLIAGSPGAGQRYATLELTNRSRHACHTYGYVGMLLLGASGRALPTHVVRDRTRTPTRVVLAPGAKATALLHWSAVPGVGDQSGPCVAPPRKVEVTPPDERSHLTLGWTGGPVCERGRIDVSALAHG